MLEVDRQVCFRLADAVPAASLPHSPRLAGVHAEALVELLQIFACGEESAAIAFAGLGGSSIEVAARHALMHIAGEELVHEGLLRGLRAALPAPPRDRELRRALSQFYHGIARADIGLHLAAIASLDSAVCVILSALLQPGGGVVEQDVAVAAIFRRIHRDEAKHVRLSRRLAIEFVRGNAIGAVAERTRLDLVTLLARRGAAFERLNVDAERLFARLGRVPDRLFR
jgi:hypothetical protein